MLFHRDVVDQAGGMLKALGAEIAEDAAFTKMVRNAGLRVHLVDTPFDQPLGDRTAAEVWSRQARWSMLRRSTFPVMFMPELLVGGFFPIVAGIYAAWQYDVNVAVVAAALGAVWFGSEAILARSAGWHFSGADAARLRRAGRAASGAVGRGLAPPRLRLARQCHERAGSGRRGAGMMLSTAVFALGIGLLAGASPAPLPSPRPRSAPSTRPSGCSAPTTVSSSIDRYDDPDVPNVSCYVSRAETGGIKGSLWAWREDPSQVLHRLPRRRVR